MPKMEALESHCPFPPSDTELISKVQNGIQSCLIFQYYNITVMPNISILQCHDIICLFRFAGQVHVDPLFFYLSE